VMVMTAEPDLTLRSEIFAAGAALFIQKPFTSVQMHTMLRLLVSKAAVSRNKKTKHQKARARIA
jgi:FixJ family two-component response regulator